MRRMRSAESGDKFSAMRDVVGRAASDSICRNKASEGVTDTLESARLNTVVAEGGAEVVE